MSLLTTRIRLIRETNKMYNDHFDSVLMFSQATGADVDLEGIQHAQRAAMSEIIEATTLDNID